MRLLPFLLLVLLLPGCRNRPASTGPIACLDGVASMPWAEAKARCPMLPQRLRALAGPEAGKVMAPLDASNAQGTNMDGLWLTFYGEDARGGKRAQGVVVYDYTNGCLCAGHWREGDALPWHRCAGGQAAPPPLQAWIDDAH